MRDNPIRFVGVMTFCVVLLSLTANLLYAQDQEALRRQMEQGNELYEAGKYSEAIQIYGILVDSGVDDASLYYNLGNAYYKAGDLGRAVLNYERAAQLQPRDADIRANLTLARTQKVDKFFDQQESLLNQLAVTTARWLNINEVATIAFLLWLISAIVWVLYRRRILDRPRLREGLSYLLGLIAFLLVCAVVVLTVRITLMNNRPAAVIVAAEVDVLSGPGEQYVTEFTLHGGSKVSLIETRGQWSRLALPGEELQGWIPRDAMEPISRNFTN